MLTTLTSQLIIITIVIWTSAAYLKIALNGRWLLIALTSYCGFLCIYYFKIQVFNNELLLSLIQIIFPNLIRLSWPWGVTITGIFYCFLIVTAIDLFDRNQDKHKYPSNLINDFGFKLKIDKSGIFPCFKILILLLITRYYLSLIVGGDDGVLDPEELMYLAFAQGTDKTLFFFGILHLCYSQTFKQNPIIYQYKSLAITPTFALTVFTFAIFNGIQLVSFERSLIFISSFILMGIYAVIFIWMRQKTGSLLIPVICYGVTMFFSQLL